MTAIIPRTASAAETRSYLENKGRGPSKEETTAHIKKGNITNATNTKFTYPNRLAVFSHSAVPRNTEAAAVSSPGDKEVADRHSRTWCPMPRVIRNQSYPGNMTDSALVARWSSQVLALASCPAEGACWARWVALSCGWKSLHNSGGTSR